LNSLGKPKLETIEEELRTWKGEFPDIPEMEKRLQAEITKTIAEDRRTWKLTKALERLVRDHFGKFPEHVD
jgi:hypothetical protein